jgi:hypothetical protein
MVTEKYKIKETKLCSALDDAIANSKTTNGFDIELVTIKEDTPSPKQQQKNTNTQSNKRSPLMTINSDEEESSDQSSSLSTSKKKTTVTFNTTTNSSSNSIDKPPKPPSSLTNFTPLIITEDQTSPTSSENRAKFITSKSKTIDIADSTTTQKQGDLSMIKEASTSQQNIASSGTIQKSNSNNSVTTPAPVLTASGRPIQSILRRSETPPNTKTALRQQTSIDSTESSGSNLRETSIDRLMKSSTSTSRPLMFKN